MGSLILALLALLVGCGIGGWLAYRFKVTKTEELNKGIRRQNEEFYQETLRLEQERENEVQRLDREISSHRAQLEETIQQEASIVQSISQQEQDRASEAFLAYMETLELAYVDSEQEFDEKVSHLREELDKLKSARVASIQAALREKEMKEKEDFYKIHMTDNGLSDIEILEEVKPKLHKPEVLSKLIWTTYYQKETTNLCNNVIGQNTVCGIYKITDTITGMSYVGQSVNIAQRWKDHVKNALGAGNTTTTNKLYSAMRDSGIYNFTFEVLEIVPSAQLTTQEKYYISFYLSDQYGLNSNKGVK